MCPWLVYLLGTKKTWNIGNVIEILFGEQLQHVDHVTNGNARQLRTTALHCVVWTTVILQDDSSFIGFKHNQRNSSLSKESDREGGSLAQTAQAKTLVPNIFRGRDNLLLIFCHVLQLTSSPAIKSTWLAASPLLWKLALLFFIFFSPPFQPVALFWSRQRVRADGKWFWFTVTRLSFIWRRWVIRSGLAPCSAYQVLKISANRFHAQCLNVA